MLETPLSLFVGGEEDLPTAGTRCVDSLRVRDDVIQRARLVKDVWLFSAYVVGATNNVVTGLEGFQADRARVPRDGLSKVGTGERTRCRDGRR